MGRVWTLHLSLSNIETDNPLGFCEGPPLKKGSRAYARYPTLRKDAKGWGSRFAGAELLAEVDGLDAEEFGGLA